MLEIAPRGARVRVRDGPGRAPLSRWRPDPYLHVGPDRIFNPHTDRVLESGDDGYELLRSLLAGAAAPRRDERELGDLARSGWLLPPEADADRLFRLKYVSLEAHVSCNQRCSFCPVSVAPRADHSMPLDLYRRIVGEIAGLGEPIEAVFMNGYNEPTADPRFVELVACLRSAGLPPAVLTNGSGLTPRRVDRLLALGGLAYLCVNLSTLDRERYRRERRRDHLRRVLANLDYAGDLPLAPRMEVVVLGAGDDAHRADFGAVRDRFGGSRFRVRRESLDDRAAYFAPAGGGAPTEGSLCGCEQTGSRPIQHLHVNPFGQCILCCQDYEESVVVGDLRRSSLREVLTGPAMARARRRVYGLEDAAPDFICRRCRFALRR